MAGRVVHFEIPFEDGDRAQRFYKDAFDWQLQSMPGMGYVLVTTGPTGDRGPTEPGFINGGMLSRESETVVGKQPVGDMGFSAYVKDTEGNVVGLWETAH